ncbi:MAG: hypothetical protein KC589_03945 [Nanoarchaeota archaeon]|nr:hypothetical protein [Nanoarchaeota archaeon]
MENTNLIKSLYTFGNERLKEMKDRLKQGGKTATEELINSLSCYVEDDDGLYFLYLDMINYGVYVDSGRKPGRRYPPREKIRKWINDKGIRADGISEEQLSFLIQRKIGIRGISPFPFLYIFYEPADKLATIVEEGLAKDIQKDIDDFIEKYNT